MQFDFLRGAFALLAATAIGAGAAVNSNEALVFVSSFKAGKEGAIEALRLNVKSGTLTPLRRAANVENSYFITVSPDQKYLYSIHAKEFGSKENEEVAAFAIVGRSGELKALNRQSTHGSAACYLHLDGTGKTLLVANYMNGSVASLPVREDGSLGEAVSVMQHTGTRGPAEAQEGPHAHCILPSPDNRFALAADLGLDQVLVYRLDAAKTKLTKSDNGGGKTAAGAGPRHMTFHPNGKTLYVINELGGTVTCFAYDAEKGMLSERQTIATLPNDFKGKNACADVKITPDGRYLYGTNRGHDSIAVYRIDGEGRLALVEIRPSLGQEAQNLAITAGGELLLCANMAGNNIAVFRIDAQTGRLSAVGTPVKVASPACMRLVW